MVSEIFLGEIKLGAAEPPPYPPALRTAYVAKSPAKSTKSVIRYTQNPKKVIESFFTESAFIIVSLFI
jgi:hypothetical protein